MPKVENREGADQRGWGRAGRWSEKEEESSPLGPMTADIVIIETARRVVRAGGGEQTNGNRNGSFNPVETQDVCYWVGNPASKAADLARKPWIVTRSCER
jgi:hypothetical protein